MFPCLPGGKYKTHKQVDLMGFLLATYQLLLIAFCCTPITIIPFHEVV